MTFKVGDKVVCLCNRAYARGYLFEGSVYTVVEKCWTNCQGWEVSLEDVNNFPSDFITLEDKNGLVIRGLADESLCEMFNYLRKNGVNPRVVEKYLEQKGALVFIYEAIAEGCKKERQ